MSNSGFSIESGLFLAPSIATIPCRTERLDSYEDMIPDYQGRNFTYMPMPYDEKYYNTEEGWLRDIRPEQYVREDTHLIEVLKKLQNHPFLLIDYQLTWKIELFEEKILLPQSIVEHYAIDYDQVVTYENSLGIDTSGLLDDLDSSLGFAVQFANDVDDSRISHYTVEELRSGDHKELLSLVNNIYSKIGPDDRFGIITISDLNRRPMKEMIYRALSELEIIISKNIESDYDDSRRLFKAARPATIGRWEKDQIEGLDLHIAEYMTLIELQQSLKMSDMELIDSCGFESKSQVDDLSSINSLRNKVMHANRTLIHNRRDIGKMINKLYRIEDIINDASSVQNW